MTSAERLNIEQGTAEWLSLRKSKITATDAPVIMHMSPWKTPLQLYKEKQAEIIAITPTARMQRGIDLEPVARNLFTIETGIHVQPAVIVRDWAMASLDGMSACGQHIVEIKCPGERDHEIAKSGKVPDHYYPQIQHQIFVSGVSNAFYYSFDGSDGVAVVVVRDDDFIHEMVEKEKKFYGCLLRQEPPELIDRDFIERDDEIWLENAGRLREVQAQLKALEAEEEELRKRLIFLSGESNSRGGGISLSQVTRKGNVDYAKIPELKGVDLEVYRKAPITSWRISNAS